MQAYFDNDFFEFMKKRNGALQAMETSFLHTIGLY